MDEEVTKRIIPDGVYWDFFFQAEDGIRDLTVTGVQTCALPILFLEALARSGSELLEGFKEYRYPNEIGPGVYDIHSPRVPSTAEIVQALKRMQEVLDRKSVV